MANSKRWGILFTCLVCRGVHVEVVEEMTSSSFINAFKRSVAIRGNVKQVRSDRGTNFVGATDSLMIDAVNVEDGPVKTICLTLELCVFSIHHTPPILEAFWNVSLELLGEYLTL